jgi:putative tryptophan/tyrosine transport system substrate-binding protein
MVKAGLAGSPYMRRRDFIRIFDSAAAAWPLAARAQQLMPVIGLLHSASAEAFAPFLIALREGLNESGFVDGQNVRIDFRWAEGQYDRLPTMAKELVDQQVALIVAGGGDRPALAAKAATTTIPIVFTGSDDPVGFGLVTSLNRPGGNVTGVSLFTSELEVKRFALLRELAPTIPRIAMLVNPSNPTAEPNIRDVQAAADAIGQQVDFLRASSEREIDSAFRTMVGRRTDALLVAHDPFLLSRREQLVTLAAYNMIPAIYEFRDFVLVGGLMSYGSKLTDNYRLAGGYVGKILKGAKPADLPVQQPTKLTLTINLKTAKSLGLEIPAKLLALADEVIE